MQATYTKLFADAGGVSHFEDVTLPMPLGFAVPPAEPLNVAQIGPAAMVSLIGGSPNWKGDAAHPTPRRLLFVFLQGEVQVTASDGTARRFHAGDVLLAEDTTGQGHSSRITGTEEWRAVVVTLAD